MPCGSSVTEHVYLPVSRLAWFDWKIVCLLHSNEGQIGALTERSKRLESIVPHSLGTTRTGDGKVAVSSTTATPATVNRIISNKVDVVFNTVIPPGVEASGDEVVFEEYTR